MIWILIILILLVLAVFAADYFFRYTFTRAEKPEPWEDERKDMILKDRAFFEKPDRELLEITSRDGLRLRAWFYDCGGETTVILCHGYRGGPEELTGIASELYARGMNVLLIWQRAHGLSEGKTFTMGVREKLDAVDWAKKIAQLRPDGKIVLFGWSMGGNTVMGAVGEDDLPQNVACAVDDCGYENLREQILFSCRASMPRLPAKRFFVGLLGLYCRLFKGFSLEESRRETLRRCRIPMLFIHGGKDKVVPYENLDICYEACAAEKRRSSYAQAIHVGSCASERERYFAELCGFINDNCKEGQKCTLT